MLHSVTRPVELRYTNINDDINDDIEQCARFVDGLASTGAQAEQRDIHLQVEELLSKQKATENLLSDMQRTMNSESKTTENLLLDIQRTIHSESKVGSRESYLLSFAAYQSLNTNSFLDTSDKLSDLQLSQIMDSITDKCRYNALESLQYCAFMRSQHSFTK